MIPFIDLHAHLDFPQILKNIDTIITKLEQSETRVITCGVNPDSNRATLKLAKKTPFIKAALGLYPMDALGREQGKENLFDVDKEIEFIRKQKKKIVAISEIGMDFYNGGQDEESREKQKTTFKKIIELSKEIHKPMIIHSRKAERQVVEILEESNIKPELVIMHCFSGRKSLIKKCIENKWYFTIPTNVTRAENFQGLIKKVDMNHLFCETDSPWLSPFARDGINEPSNVIESYKKIAEIKGMELEEVKNNIFMNYQKLFN